jgi:pimeloyl-ACP methyl ester carboxylesterase
MTTITTKDDATTYYKDWGKRQPVVFSHGWPLSVDAFEDQMLFLADRGYRCTAHDRVRVAWRHRVPCGLLLDSGLLHCLFSFLQASKDLWQQRQTKELSAKRDWMDRRKFLCQRSG